MDSTSTDATTAQTKKPMWKKWWFWFGVVWIVAAIAMNEGGGGDGGSGSSNNKVENGVGKVTYTVDWVIAGERKRTFEKVSVVVYEFLNDEPEAKSLDVTMRVECEDTYGNKKMKESHVKVSEEDVIEMRKYKSGDALAEGCLDWQIAFEIGYKMCGQID